MHGDKYNLHVCFFRHLCEPLGVISALAAVVNVENVVVLFCWAGLNSTVGVNFLLANVIVVNGWFISHEEID